MQQRIQYPLGEIRRLRIFLASPDDLVVERSLAKEVVDRVNRHVARPLGVFIELHGWEDTLPGFSRPQAKINRDLEECDLFVGLLWQRWGTPPGDGDGKYSSGFEEEFYLAMQLRRVEDMRDVVLFFKEMSDDVKRDPGPQAKQVIQFQASVQKDRELLYKTFVDENDWERRFHDFLAETIVREFALQPEKGQQIRSTTEEEEGGAIGTEGALEMVRSLAAERVGQSEDTIEIARAFLFCASLWSWNVRQDHVLDTQILHSLYVERERILLQQVEQLTLVKTLLADPSELLVGWFWIDLQEDVYVTNLEHLAIDHSGLVARNALSQLRLGWPDLLASVVQTILERDDADSKKLAVDVIASDPLDSYESVLQLAQSEDQGVEIRKAGWSGQLRLLAARSPSDAVDFILRTDVSDRGYLDDSIRSTLDSEDRDAIHRLRSDVQGSVRRACVRATVEEIPDEELTTLMFDEDVSIASDATIELIKRGKKIEENFFRKRFERPRPRSGRLGMLAQALGDFNSDREEFERRVLPEYYRSLSKEELESRIDWTSEGADCYAALLDRDFGRRVDQARSDLEKQFDRIYQAWVEDIKSRLGDRAAEFIESRVVDFVRDSFTSRTLEVLAKHATKDTVTLARRFVSAESDSLFRRENLTFALDIFEEAGSAEDVDYLLESIESIKDVDIAKRVVDLALSLGATDAESIAKRIWELEIPSLTKATFRNLATANVDLQLNDLREFLYSESQIVRDATLAYLVKTWSDKDLRQLLTEYPIAEGFSHYYLSVVCWLDRVLFAPEKVAAGFRNLLLDELEPEILLDELLLP